GCASPRSRYGLHLPTRQRNALGAGCKGSRVSYTQRGRVLRAARHRMPQHNVYETVLRDGMATDALDPVGIYFGTRSGKLYGSRDEGENWRPILDGVPAITCVKAVTV